MTNINITYVTPLSRATLARNDAFRDRRPRQETRDEAPKDDESAPERQHRVDITV